MVNYKQIPDGPLSPRLMKPNSNNGLICLNTSRSSFWKHREPTGRANLMITPLRDINDRIALTRGVIGRSITQKQGEWAPFF